MTSLLAVEPGLQTARGLVELAAVEHVDLAQRRRPRLVALVEMPLVEVVDGDGEGAPGRRRDGEGEPGDGQEATATTCDRITIMPRA